MTMIYNYFGGSYKDTRDPKNQFARFAVEPEKLFTIFGEYRMPDDQKQAFLKERAACLIGRDLANSLKLNVGDRIHIIGDIYPGDFDFTVRGVFDSPQASDVLYFNKEYLEESMPEGRRGRVGMFYILIDDPAHSARVAQTIDEQFHNATQQTKTETEQAFVVSFLSLLGNVKMLLLGISGAVVFTILLVSANTMAMSVRERVREVGVLKTLGFTPEAVLGLVLGEAVAISLVGGAIGYLISTFLMRGVAKSPFGGFLPPMADFNPAVALTCVAAAAAIGFLSSLVPALNASRIPIVEALRSTD
jgi:putative ABC transport system permease protein